MELNLNSLEATAVRWIHPNKKRYYRLMLNKDLLSDWVITKAWGGINTANGRVVHVPCPNKEFALNMMLKLQKVRKQRGYILS